MFASSCAIMAISGLSIHIFVQQWYVSCLSTYIIVWNSNSMSIFFMSKLSSIPPSPPLSVLTIKRNIVFQFLWWILCRYDMFCSELLSRDIENFCMLMLSRTKSETNKIKLHFFTLIVVLYFTWCWKQRETEGKGNGEKEQSLEKGSFDSYHATT